VEDGDLFSSLRLLIRLRRGVFLRRMFSPGGTVALKSVS
jgi:hypothetical protein